MAYTVKQLSELSGVTVRTLHFYEEVGLLKPAYYGANRYRYYEEKELLQLQQILFFKELGFTLKQIRKVLGRSDFDQLAALHSHKLALTREWKKIGKLIETIDKTIKHLQGKKKMKDKEIFGGFSLIKVGKGSETYFAAEELVLQSLKEPAVDRGQLFREEVDRTARNLYSKLVDCMEKDLGPSTEKVQSLIQKHYALTETFHHTTNEMYRALAQLYLEHPEFRKQLDAIHPKLAEFLFKAMHAFADSQLR